MLQKENILATNRNYETNDIIYLMGTKYKKVHSYVNNCLLCKKNFKS